MVVTPLREMIHAYNIPPQGLRKLLGPSATHACDAVRLPCLRCMTELILEERQQRPAKRRLLLTCQQLSSVVQCRRQCRHTNISGASSTKGRDPPALSKSYHEDQKHGHRTHRCAAAGL